VFDNDFPALLPDAADAADTAGGDELFRFQPAAGTCRVMCFHPRSDRTLPLMAVSEIVDVIDR